MITARFDLLQPPTQVEFVPAEPTPPSAHHGRLTGWLLLVTFSLLLLAWFAWRLFGRPLWLDQLPAVAREALALLEAAGVLTMAVLWTGLIWRRYWAAFAQVESLPVPVDTVEELYSLSPAAFERYVAGLFRWKGYQVQVRGRSGDHGVDLELVTVHGRRGIVQCKRYQHTVGEKIVRDLFGTLLHERAAHAFLVTTADISPAAYAWAAGKPITLIDGTTLVKIAAVTREDLRSFGGTKVLAK
jgi:HJR/Mrr/RecB family endonuclease